MAPPSAALEHGSFDVAGGVKPFTSGASDIDIPQSLMLACFVVFISYNIVFLCDVHIPAIVNSGTTFYQTLVYWFAFARRHVRNARSLGFRRALIQIYIFSRDWSASIYRSSMNAHALRTGLKRMISNPGEHLGQTVLVDTVTVPGAGSLALIRGLPSDVSASELRRYLESILFIQYLPQLIANHTVHHSIDHSVQIIPGHTKDAPINTTTLGLWNGTCVQSNDDAPSTSGIHTPTSEASVSDISAADDTSPASASSSPDFDNLAPVPFSPRHSHSRRT